MLLRDASQHRPTPISQWSEAERVLIPGSKPGMGGAVVRVKNNKLRRGRVVRMRNTRERGGDRIGELPAVGTSRLYVQ